MNETEFQALFEAYDQARRNGADNPIPQKLHLLIYNYAQLRHQQSSDVSANFYLHVVGKLAGILERYDADRLPFYQYIAANLNYEFHHFLRRRKLPRSQIELLSLEELADRRLELAHRDNNTPEPLSALFVKLPFPQAVYAKLALAYPLSVKDLRFLIRRQRKRDEEHWQTLRAYRAFLRFAEEKRAAFIRERDRLQILLMRLDDEEARGKVNSQLALQKRRDSARKKFFSMDTRIPIRIVAAVTGDPIATAQRQLKLAMKTLQSVYDQWEKQNLLGIQKKPSRGLLEN